MPGPGSGPDWVDPFAWSWENVLETSHECTTRALLEDGQLVTVGTHATLETHAATLADANRCAEIAFRHSLHSPETIWVLVEEC